MAELKIRRSTAAEWLAASTQRRNRDILVRYSEDWVRMTGPRIDVRRQDFDEHFSPRRSRDPEIAWKGLPIAIEGKVVEHTSRRFLLVDPELVDQLPKQRKALIIYPDQDLRDAVSSWAARSGMSQSAFYQEGARRLIRHFKCRYKLVDSRR